MGVTVQDATTSRARLRDGAVIILAHQWCISQTGDDWGLRTALVLVDTVSISDQNSSNTLLYPRSAQAPLPFRVDPNYWTLGMGRDSDTWARVPASFRRCRLARTAGVARASGPSMTLRRIVVIRRSGVEALHCHISNT